MSRLVDLARATGAMKAARPRERWPAERMREHQAQAVDELVRHAVARSPFYRDRYAGLVGDRRVELAALPPLDKATLMANLDGALCEPRLRGVDLRAHAGDARPLLGDYHVMTSSGSTGTPSLYVYSRADWTGILALFLRYSEMAGLRPRIPRVRIAAIGAPTVASMTRRTAHAVDVGLHRVLALSAADPLPHLVDRLNRFQPQVINAYASTAALLADERLAGRLRVAPRLVSTTSELRTAEMGERIERAFGAPPHDLFGSSEGLWGFDCEHHRGIHLFEDWCVVENVDADGRSVPDGEPGERVLVTNLFNRTLPLIRFELSDVVAVDRGPCPCGRTLARVSAIRGRSADVLRLAGAGGRSVPVHPSRFGAVAAHPAVRELQIVQRGELIVLRLALREGADPAAPGRLTAAMVQSLSEAGVERPSVEAEVVPALERTPAGKLRVVVVEEESASGLAAAR